MKNSIFLILWTTLSLFADRADFSQISPEQKAIQIPQLGLVIVNYRKIHQQGEYNEIELSVDWKKGKEHSQVLYEGMSCALDTIKGAGNSIIVSQYGNRFDYEGHRYHVRYTYKFDTNRFVEDSSWTTDTWAPYMNKVKHLLKKDSVSAARKLVQERGTSPNGHLDQDSLFTVLFAKAAHDKALKLWREGRKKHAAEYTYDFFLNTPRLHFRAYDKAFSEEWYLLHILETNGYNRMAPTATNTEVINNLAFFLQDTEYAWISVELLQQVIHFYPKRAVAYLNLGDAHATLGQIKLAERCYTDYIALMKQAGKEHKIPKRIQAFE